MSRPIRVNWICYTCVSTIAITSTVYYKLYSTRKIAVLEPLSTVTAVRCIICLATTMLKTLFFCSGLADRMAVRSWDRPRKRRPAVHPRYSPTSRPLERGQYIYSHYTPPPVQPNIQVFGVRSVAATCLSCWLLFCLSVNTFRKVFVYFADCDRWRYGKALCDLKFSQMEGNGQKFAN